MGLTEDNINSRVAEELAFKLRLERPLAPKIRNIFRQMGKNLAVVYTETGIPLNAAEYHDDFVAVLKPTYVKAAKGVGDQIRENIKSYFGPVENKQEAIVSANIREFVDTQPVQAANEITETNQKQINESLTKVITDAALEGEELSQAEIGERAGKDFTDTNLYRGDLIAETEVQNAVEGSKFTELETILALSLVIGGVSITDRVKREWVTVLDTKTRDSHVRADGQRVEGTHTPFRVGSSLMKYPGDSSLGAPVKEIARCRCGAHTMLSPDQPIAEQVAF